MISIQLIRPMFAAACFACLVWGLLGALTVPSSSLEDAVFYRRLRIHRYFFSLPSFVVVIVAAILVALWVKA